MGHPGFIFLAQIIFLYSKSLIFPRNMQLTPNLGIKCFYSNKAHKNVKRYKFINPIQRTTQQQQAQPSFIILQRVWILQSLNTTWFNNLPLFDEEKSLVLVFDLIESEAVPAKIAYIQSNASYNSRLDFHTLKA